MGRLTLPGDGPVYIDASATIYSVEKIEPYWTILQPMWLAAQVNQFTIISSELLLLETLVKPLQEADSVLETSFRNLLLNTYEVQLVPISRSILDAAAHLRATINIKTPDAIHAATALATNCTLFVTNDSDFRRVSRLPIALLSEIASASP